jgi:predicted RecA/RadA family phage recombinase
MSSKNLRPSVVRSNLDWTNTTGSSIPLGGIVRAGGGWGRATTVIANNAGGVLETAGVIEVTKVNTDVYAVGDTVYWDTTNNRAAPGTTIGVGTISPVPLGVVRQAAGNGTTRLRVELNAPPEVMRFRAVGNASGGGYTINTGLGRTPTGPITINIRSSAGAWRVVNSAVWGSGGTAGQLTIVTAAGAADDDINIEIGR